MNQVIANPVDVRESLVDALRLDRVGRDQGLGDLQGILPQAPSRWYLTEFLVPTEADHSQCTDLESADTMDELGEPGGADDVVTPEPAAEPLQFASAVADG